MNRRLTPAELDRSAGALIGAACGAALGAGYEHGYVNLPDDIDAITMTGGGIQGGPPGEWTGDVALWIAFAQALADGADPRTEDGLDRIAARFADWSDSHPPDIGRTTRAALAAGRTAAAQLEAAQRHARVTGHASGNGSVMRTGAAALAYLGDDEAITTAAIAQSELTHAHDDPADACVIISIAVDRAIRDGRLDGARDGIALLPAERRDRWTTILDEAATGLPHRTDNGQAAGAVRHALTAIAAVDPDGLTPTEHLVKVLKTAVSYGFDTDTVASIAGTIVGGKWGATAIPAAWKLLLHGWPGLRCGDLTRLAVRLVSGGDDGYGWPTAPTLDAAYRVDWNAEPYLAHLAEDPDVLFGNVFVLDDPAYADEIAEASIISLCRIGADQVRDEHLEVWLVDKPDPTLNPHLDFILADTADQIAAWRAEGRKVFVHCVAGCSRTPTVVATYLARHLGVRPAAARDSVLAQIHAAGPAAVINPAFAALFDDPILDADR